MNKLKNRASKLCFFDYFFSSTGSKYFSKASRMITPEGFTWDYGIPWSDLCEDYSCFYSKQFIYPNDNPQSAYFMRTKQYFNRKK